MYIQRLTLKNWRSHSNSTFEFGKINLIRGPNNSGKSSVAMAIEYALTGRCDGTDERGSLSDRFITVAQGVKSAKITALLTVNKGLPAPETTTLERTRAFSGGTFSCGAMNEKDWNALVDRDLLSAAFRVGRFLDLSRAEQDSLLGDLLRPEPVVIPPGVHQDALIAEVSFNGAHALGLDTVRELEKQTVKRRAECTAILREMGEPVKVEPRPADAPSSAACQKRLDSLRMEQNSLVREKENLLGKWQARQQAARAALESLPGLKKQVLNRDEEDRLMKVVEREKEINDALASISRFNFEIADLEQQKKMAGLKAGKCPTCGHETETEDLIKRYDDGIKARRSRIPTLELLVGGMPLALAKEGLRKHREAFTEVDKLEKLLSATPADEPQPDTAHFDKEIADHEERIKKGQEIVAQIATFEAAFANYETQVRKRDGTLARREAYDRIAKWAAAVQQTMNSDKLGDFRTALNETMHKLGYDIQYSETGLMLGGRFPIGQQFQLDRFSQSEKWRFSVAFQIAVAKVSKLNAAIFDGADILVGENRVLLMQAVTEAGLEQVFILASTDREVDFPPEVRVFTLRNVEGQTVVA